MIFASGIVTFLIEPKPKIRINRKLITLKVIKDYYPEDDLTKLKKIACRFTVILPNSFECRSLEDYTGKIKPFIEKETHNIVSSVEISHLNYLSSQEMDSITGKR